MLQDLCRHRLLVTRPFADGDMLRVLQRLLLQIMLRH
jgi:hypothetical protein